MDRPRPSIITALFWAYWDLCHVLRKAWRPALFAFLILSVGSVVAAVGPIRLTYDPLGRAAIRLAILVGLCFLLTPFFLAMHRFVLLGEEPIRYDFTPSSPRFQMFFGWFAVCVVLASFPAILAALAETKGPVYYVGRPPAGLDPWISRTASTVAWLVLQQLLVLFPAMAVDAPGAGWQNAISDTRNQIWYAIAVTILPFIPVALLGLAGVSLLKAWVWAAPGTLAGLVASLLWLGTTLLIASTLLAVIASRLYQVIGERLNTPLR
ncbi:hypothetical protein [Bradyrhizobium sp. CB3481]|uniref:hypothetical protein n=1 Tax=Bradyrhizobium sp. CB3481 TaxID=3039158 RepID=UPI0024B0BAC8|nr:hypothetical protein [Bradyrhizobium sp. CB3481]WFU19576.1 hypothetical protein QA643_15200 [Bradyrhizobium sp. CB3481]